MPGAAPARKKAECIEHMIIYKECVDSTNEEAKRGGDRGALHGTVYCADRQTAGKGRRGRSWLSESEENLYFTILLRPKLPTEKVTMLTLVMAYAVALAVEKVTGLQAGIKWPNDIVVNDKKVCGILSEMKVEKQKPAYCVIGVGMNIGRTQFPEELREKATSLWTEMMNKKESGVSDAELLAKRAKSDKMPAPDKEILLQEILITFEEAYKTFSDAKSLHPILEVYNAHLVNKGRSVRVLEPGGEYEGVAMGVTATGELLVEKDDKTLQKVYAGEVSVRGLYGYV